MKVVDPLGLRVVLISQPQPVVDRDPLDYEHSVAIEDLPLGNRLKLISVDLDMRASSARAKVPASHPPAAATT